MKLSFVLLASANNIVAAELYTHHFVQWGGKGYENSGANAMYQPGTCSDPQGRMTLTCGRELRLVDVSANNHDCEMDPASENIAYCSSHGELSKAMVLCLGDMEQELNLTATLDEATADCEAEGTYAKNSIYLFTRCADWIDLDDQCSAWKVGSGSPCCGEGGSSCSIWPTVACTATIDEVTVMSVGQSNSTCVHSVEITGGDPATTTTAATTTNTAAIATAMDLYTSHFVQWGGKGFKNSGADEMYQPGTCSDPQGRMTLTCGRKLRLDDVSINNHDCEMDPASENTAYCSSHGELSQALVSCLGDIEQELKLTATLDEATADCEAEGTYAKNSVYLTTKCADWIDLDDQCSALKVGSGSADSRYLCYDQGGASCYIWPEITCTATLGEVTVMSVGQNDSTCVHSVEISTEDPTTTTTTNTAATATATTASSMTSITGTGSSPAASEGQCQTKTSKRETCEFDAILDVQGLCEDNGIVNFEDLSTCYKAVDNCEEVAKSVCSVNHCCLGRFIDEVNCLTGCQVDCEEIAASIASAQKKTRDNSGSNLYLPEMCLNLPPENEDDDIETESENDAFVAQFMLPIGLLVTLMQILI